MTNPDIIQRLSRCATAEQWKTVGIANHHGIAIPLFSLHTAESCGIGEYPDLIPLIDWCRSLGLDCIQLLPLNDNGLDTSPYCSLSAFALNPLHIGLTSLDYIDSHSTFKESIAAMQTLTRTTQRVDYPVVQKMKEEFFRLYYRLFGKQICARNDYATFMETNKDWLEKYGLFKALKIANGWSSWETWGPLHKDPSPAYCRAPPFDIAEEASYHIFLQYLCFQQMIRAKSYAERHGLFIKGDIPILVNRESADVWAHKELFLMQLAAGAPPDMYSQDGQKWGFPLYNWDAIASQHYKWWMVRLGVASQLYHLYRIDHIVGFFRIWGIPLSRPARDGHFIPEDPSRWIPQGEAIMKVMIANCPLLPIGEDLGTVPPSVRECLKALGICGTKVMRWERRWEQDRGYIDPRDYPAESMTTVSTHDSETLEQWWKNRPDEAKLYAETQQWTYSPQITQQQRMRILYDSHHSGSLFHINLLPEYLALIPGMTWPNPDDERINIPGTISSRNWSYRLRPSLEEIATNAPLQKAMEEILRD